MGVACLLKLQAHTQNTQYILFFRCNNGTPQRLNFTFIRALLILFKMIRTEQEPLHSVFFTWNLTLMSRVVLLAIMVQLNTVLIEFMLYGESLQVLQHSGN